MKHLFAIPIGAILLFLMGMTYYLVIHWPLWCGIALVLIVIAYIMGLGVIECFSKYRLERSDEW